MIPSAKTIERCGVDRKTALHVRRILDGRCDPRTVPAVRKWIDQCLHEPHVISLELCAVDALLGTCGVEQITAHHARYHDVYVRYANNGDSYAHTLCYLQYGGLWPPKGIRAGWHVAGWADMVEYLERQGFTTEE